MDYATLKLNIQEIIESPFTEEQLAMFTQQAEQKIFNTVQLPSLRKNVIGSTTPNNKYLSTPSDFLSVFSVAVVQPNGDYEYLLNKDVNFIRQAYPSASSVGVPKYYAIFGPTTTDGNPPALTNELSLILGFCE